MTFSFKNLITGNWNSLPRFYPMMFLCKITRVRGAPDLLTNLLKKTNMRVEFQTIIRLMSYLIFVMQICACLLRSGVDFAL